MSEKLLNVAFVEALNNKIPKKAQLADFITDALSIEKETAYRRLRSVTMFTFQEIALLCRKLSISIDEILINSEKEIPISNMMINSFYESGKQEQSEQQDFSYGFVREFVRQPYSEFGSALKSIPYSLLDPYSHISKFYKLKYMLRKNDPHNKIQYKDVTLDNLDLEAVGGESNIYHQVRQTIYIWDKKIIPTIVEDVKYYRSLGIMDANEVKLLKNELLQFINDLELLAERARYAGTGNKVDIYISDEDIDSTYAYLWSEQSCLSIIITYMCYVVTSLNNKSKCKETMDWIASMKYNATLISASGGKERVLFFNAQREAVHTL